MHSDDMEGSQNSAREYDRFEKAVSGKIDVNNYLSDMEKNSDD